ncbi:ATP-binding protein [Streptomyces sp. NPDC056600]|uniref:ATP-binding protein n=1 Tax=Streptomyces sp. NPDC056600 TaxID=3345874 RepID=UPI003695C252
MSVAAVETVEPGTVRTEELDRLLRAVDTAAAGGGRAVELAGDPGTGKTRLLSALAHRARRKGLTVLRGHCTEAGRAIRFHPLTQALTAWPALDGPGAPAPPAAALVRALAEDPSAGGTADFTQRCLHYTELRHRIGACLSGAPGGLLLMLDDCHWADPASVALLDMLVRWPVEGGLALVVAHRPRQSPVDLSAALRHGVEQGTADLVELPALSLEQTGRLLGAPVTAPATVRLHQESRGTPLYLTMLASAERADDAPDLFARGGSAARLLAETTHLEEPVRTAADAAAVLGDAFDVDSVAAVAGLDRDLACAALGELRRRDLVRPAVPGRLTFRHPLLRTCLYAATDACWRAGAHRRARRWCTEAGASAVDLAPHVARSGSAPEPSDLRVLASAARAELHRGRPADAARWLTAAIRMQRTAPQQTGEVLAGAELWRPVVQALTASGDADGVRVLVRELLAAPALTGRAGTPDRVASAVLLSAVLASLGLDEEALSLIGAELDSTPAPASGDLALLHVQQRVVKVLAGQVPVRADAEALVRQTAEADAMTAAGALVLRGMCAVLTGDARTAEMALYSAAQTLDDLDDGQPADEQESVYLLMLSWAEALMGWYGPACGHGERALSAVRERGDAHLLPPLLDTLAYVHHQAGHLADALSTAQEGRAVAEAAGRTDHVGLSDAIAAAAWAQLGQTPGASPAPPADGEPSSAPRTPLSALLIAESLLAAGDGAAALALLLPRREAWRVSEPVAVLAARGYELLAAAGVQSGVDADSVQEWADQAAEAASAVGLPEQQGHALLACGHALLARGLREEAAGCYRDALELFVVNSPSGARAKELARAAHRAAGGRPEQALAELTLREREVAALAGEGRKSREIAEELRVSPRTVDAHLTRIYSKLGVSSRAELARLLALAG